MTPLSGVTQNNNALYNYAYTDQVYPYTQGAYPGDLSGCLKQAAGKGQVKVLITFSEPMTTAGKVQLTTGTGVIVDGTTNWIDSSTMQSVFEIPEGPGKWDGKAVIKVKGYDNFTIDDSSKSASGELDTDGDGQANGFDTNHFFTIDTIGPNLTIKDSQGQVIPDDGIINYQVINVTAVEPQTGAGIDKLEIRQDSPKGKLLFSDDTDYPQTHTYHLTNLCQKTQFVKAIDKAGNETISQITVDYTPPRMGLLTAVVNYPSATTLKVTTVGKDSLTPISGGTAVLENSENLSVLAVDRKFDELNEDVFSTADVSNYADGDMLTVAMKVKDSAQNESTEALRQIEVIRDSDGDGIRDKYDKDDDDDDPGDDGDGDGTPDGDEGDGAEDGAGDGADTGDSNDSGTLLGRDPNIKTGIVGDIQPGQVLSYRIEYENVGAGTAYGVYFTDCLDEDLDTAVLEIDPVYSVQTNQIIAPAGTYDPLTRTITWKVGRVNSQEGGYTNVRVKAKDDLTLADEIVNFATVYFPSVPEETRTNSVVNRLPISAQDVIPPYTTAQVVPEANTDGWNNQDITVTLTSQDDPAGTGLARIHYALTGAQQNEETVWESPVSFNVTQEGTWELTYYGMDNSGNIEDTRNLTLKLDKTRPTVTAVIEPQPNNAGWNNTEVIASFTADDNLSGVKQISEPVILTENAANQQAVGQAIDYAGNITNMQTQVNIDMIDPQISAQISPEPNAAGWNNSDTAVNFNAQDNLSGIVQITPGQTITTEGENQIISGQAQDAAGNTAQTDTIVNLDKTSPQISITSPEQNQQYQLNNPIAVTYSADDNLSGVNITAVKLDGQDISGQTEITPVSGRHNLEVITTDKADNQTRAAVDFTVIIAQEKIPAQVTIKPEVFVFNQGVFLALVQLPKQYNVSDIVQASCDGAIARLIIPIPEIKTAIMIFRRQDITELPIDTAFVVRGKLKDGQEFEGTDTIKKVLNKGFKNLLEKLKGLKEETEALDQVLDLMVQDKTKRELIKRKLRE